MWRIEQADVLEWLKAYSGGRFNALLSDPPYGLAFMGKSWDKFKSPQAYQEWVTEWASLLIEKALYPGAVCLFFGGTRTWHRLACGLEDAGFEIDDSLALLWAYGSGFPKSLSLGKALDRAAGAEREVVGVNPNYCENRVDSIGTATGIYGGAGPDKGKHITAPATEAAKRWEGHGTGLKPAFEPIILCRAPRQGKTYAELALEFGTGALWIDGGRIGTEERKYKGAGASSQKLDGHGPGDTGIGMLDGHGRDLEFTARGRFPANVILSHSESCVKKGTKKVKGTKGVRGSYGGTADRYDGKGYGIKATYEEVGYADPDGLEEVEDWDCHRDCPVGMFPQSSITGVRRVPERTQQESANTPFTRGKDAPEYTDSGSAARFFYCSKVSSSEREAGLIGHIPCVKCGDLDSKQHISFEGKGFYPLHRAGTGNIPTLEEIDEHKDERGYPWQIVKCSRNPHPTLKPALTLCKYLAKLLLPPKLAEPRRILIPFCGTGSEMAGALRAGWDEVVGVELDTDSVEIARYRIPALAGQEEKQQRLI